MLEFRKWDVAALNSMVEASESESLHLEFKSKGTISMKKTDSITKEVSGFANAVGGQLLFGIQDNEGQASAIDEGWELTERVREWLTNIINGNVLPKPDFQLVPIPIAPCRELYVVNVSPGHTAHQSRDKKYYRRRDTHSVPMDHQEILDVMNRQSRASVDVFLSVVPNGLPMKSHISTSVSEPVSVFFLARNTSSVFIKYSQLEVWLPETTGIDIDDDTFLERGWKVANYGVLPDEFGQIDGTHSKWMLRMGPAEGYFLFPYSQPTDVGYISFTFPPFIGTRFMPWRFSIPNGSDQSGILRFDMNEAEVINASVHSGESELRSVIDMM